MNFVVDPKLCIGCGTCVALAGKSFKMNDQGKAEAINPPGDEEKIIGEVIDSCPVAAIEEVHG
ncbi:MAG: ferredoxin [Candidatus Shapirobacteria bacterium]